MKLFVFLVLVLLLSSVTACQIGGSDEIRTDEDASEAIEGVTDDLSELSENLEEINSDLG